MIDVLTGLLTDMSEGFLGFFQRTPIEVLHDCLDIGLVAMLIYWALVILRGTRAMQVAIGLCLVFVGYLLSRRIGLVTVTTILDSVLAYLAVIVVIIFQSDIRRALARMGRRPLLRGQRTAGQARQPGACDFVDLRVAGDDMGEGNLCRGLQRESFCLGLRVC